MFAGISFCGWLLFRFPTGLNFAYFRRLYKNLRNPQNLIPASINPNKVDNAIPILENSYRTAIEDPKFKYWAIVILRSLRAKPVILLMS